jgi:hypothetical protein
MRFLAALTAGCVTVIMYIVAFFALVALAVTCAHAQSAPNCNQQNAILSASGTGPNYNATSIKCVAWTFSYFANGFSALSVQVESAPDNNGVPGAFTIIPAATSTTQGVAIGAQPLTTTTFNSITIRGFFPWLRVNLTSATGVGSLNYTLIGNSYIGPSSSVVAPAAASSSSIVFGPDAPGVVPTQNPIQDSGFDGTNVRRILTDAGGRTIVQTNGNQTNGDSVPNTQFTGFIQSQLDMLAVGPSLFNGATNWDREREAAFNSMPVSTTLTGRNSLGAGLVEKGSRWTVVSNPAAGTQATASIALEAGVKHIVDCVSFSASSIVAPALTSLVINVRDGATGAGTIIWTWQVAISATTGQNVAPHSICGLNLVGSSGVAMTAEFSAALANLSESVSISGLNVN